MRFAAASAGERLGTAASCLPGGESHSVTHTSQETLSVRGQCQVSSKTKNSKVKGLVKTNDLKTIGGFKIPPLGHFCSHYLCHVRVTALCPLSQPVHSSCKPSQVMITSITMATSSTVSSAAVRWHLAGHLVVLLSRSWEGVP